MRVFLRTLVALAVFVLLAVVLLWGATPKATLVGLVIADADSAPILEASVTLKSKDRGSPCACPSPRACA